MKTPPTDPSLPSKPNLISRSGWGVLVPWSAQTGERPRAGPACQQSLLGEPNEVRPHQLPPPLKPRPKGEGNGTCVAVGAHTVSTRVRCASQVLRLKSHSVKDFYGSSSPEFGSSPHPTVPGVSHSPWEISALARERAELAPALKSGRAGCVIWWRLSTHI